MTAAERRAAILGLLKTQEEPVNATALARQFSVSRQIIVGDIALLRAAGENVLATPRGYLLSRKEEGFVRRIACLHREEEMVKELEICVDHGCTVQDVIVEHPVYGQIIGSLDISSRYDVNVFMEKINSEQAQPLSALTGGIHLHTLTCDGKETYDRTCRELKQAGLLFDENS